MSPQRVPLIVWKNESVLDISSTKKVIKLSRADQGFRRVRPAQCHVIDPRAFRQVRVAFEEFSGHATQMLTRLEEMQETVSRKDFPQDLEGARRMIEEHATLKKKVIKAPIEELDTEGQR